MKVVRTRIYKSVDKQMVLKAKKALCRAWYNGICGGSPLGTL